MKFKEILGFGLNIDRYRVSLNADWNNFEYEHFLRSAPRPSSKVKLG